MNSQDFFSKFFKIFQEFKLEKKIELFSGFEFFQSFVLFWFKTAKKANFDRNSNPRNNFFLKKFVTGLNRLQQLKITKKTNHKLIKKN